MAVKKHHASVLCALCGSGAHRAPSSVAPHMHIIHSIQYRPDSSIIQLMY